jgi:hypothetical protein
VSDIPNVSDQSGLSWQSDLDTVKTAAIGRHRLETALVHGRAQSWVDRQRLWPYAVAGLLTTGLVASGIGIAGAYEDQKNVDAQHDLAPPAPVETTEPTSAPTPASPSSPPTTQPPTKLTTSSKVDQKPTTKPKHSTNDKGGVKGDDKPKHRAGKSVSKHHGKGRHAARAAR